MGLMSSVRGMSWPKELSCVCGCGFGFGWKRTTHTVHSPENMLLLFFLFFFFKWCFLKFKYKKIALKDVVLKLKSPLPIG